MSRTYVAEDGQVRPIVPRVEIAAASARLAQLRAKKAAFRQQRTDLVEDIALCDAEIESLRIAIDSLT